MSKSFPPFGRPYPDSAPCLPLPTSQLVAGKTPAILRSYPRLAVQIPPNGTVLGAHSSTGLLLGSPLLGTSSRPLFCRSASSTRSFHQMQLQLRRKLSV